MLFGQIRDHCDKIHSTIKTRVIKDIQKTKKKADENDFW